MYVDSTLAFGFYRDLTDEMEELFAGKDVRMAICGETKHDCLCPNPPWSYATSHGCHPPLLLTTAGTLTSGKTPRPCWPTRA